jgi:hypothetical protein
MKTNHSQPIINSETYSIYKLDHSIYKIMFRYTAYSLINSLVKTRIIAGSSTDEYYKIITFKADSVKSFRQYLHEYKVTTGKKKVCVHDAANMIRSLTHQLQYLIAKSSTAIIGYNPEEIVVVNDETFIFLSSELIANIDPDTEKLMISSPFSPNDFFFSPEIMKLTEIPAYIHFKTSYFSLACLIIYAIVGDDEFYQEYVKHKQIDIIINYLNQHVIYETKMYWLLSRCLIEDPKERSILLI